MQLVEIADGLHFPDARTCGAAEACHVQAPADQARGMSCERLHHYMWERTTISRAHEDNGRRG